MRIQQGWRLVQGGRHVPGAAGAEGVRWRAAGSAHARSDESAHACPANTVHACQGDTPHACTAASANAFADHRARMQSCERKGEQRRGTQVWSRRWHKRLPITVSSCLSTHVWSRWWHTRRRKPAPRRGHLLDESIQPLHVCWTKGANSGRKGFASFVPAIGATRKSQSAYVELHPAVEKKRSVRRWPRAASTLGGGEFVMPKRERTSAGFARGNEPPGLQPYSPLPKRPRRA